jgi:beta-glucosidase-like glycosyl hydrolase
MTLAEKFGQLGSFNASGNEILRLGVSRYSYHSEGLHGLRTVCKDMPGVNTTTFPQVTGMAATGNLPLILAMGQVMGDEGRAVNNIANGTIYDKGTGLNYWVRAIFRQTCFLIQFLASNCRGQP